MISNIWLCGLDSGFTNGEIVEFGVCLFVCCRAVVWWVPFQSGLKSLCAFINLLFEDDCVDGDYE